MFRRWLLVVLVISVLSAVHVVDTGIADSSSDYVAVCGSIVSESGAEFGWVVYDRDTGTITKICERKKDVPSGAQLVVHRGYIFPGLIDTHNHPHWNSIPLWRSGETYDNRYEWQGTSEYEEEVADPFDDLHDAGLTFESLTYAEIRAMMGGTTMIQGTPWEGDTYLVRNLNETTWRAVSYPGDIKQAPAALVYQAKYGLQHGLVNRLFLHVGEGKRDDKRALAEFPYLESVGMALPGVVIIHGIALTDDNLATMADNDMYLVWSPKSNNVLYGETADVLAALDAGVTVSLGPDWSISGSDNLLEELKVAWAWSRKELDGELTPKQLFRMVTTDAAIVAGAAGPAGEKLGKIAVGYEADFFLAPRLHKDPHRSLLLTEPKDIRLVVIDGRPVYGDRMPMCRLLGKSELDRIRVERRPKYIHINEAARTVDVGMDFEDLVDTLDDVLDPLAPLTEYELDGSCRGKKK